LPKSDFPKLKNFGAFKVIQSYPIDTVKMDGRYELIKNTVDPFDSGRYVVQVLRFYQQQAVLTDSLLVEVANVQVDTLKQKKCLTSRTLLQQPDWIGGN
jgi:hypothetical protein